MWVKQPQELRGGPAQAGESLGVFEFVFDFFRGPQLLKDVTGAGGHEQAFVEIKSVNNLWPRIYVLSSCAVSE